MSDVERTDHIRLPVESIIAEIPLIKNDADVEKFSPAEFDDWLKHNIVKYRYPLLGAAVIYTGWLAYRLADRFVRKIISKEQPKS